MEDQQILPSRITGGEAGEQCCSSAALLITKLITPSQDDVWVERLVSTGVPKYRFGRPGVRTSLAGCALGTRATSTPTCMPKRSRPIRRAHSFRLVVIGFSPARDKRDRLVSTVKHKQLASAMFGDWRSDLRQAASTTPVGWVDEDEIDIPGAEPAGVADFGAGSPRGVFLANARPRRNLSSTSRSSGGCPLNIDRNIPGSVSSISCFFLELIK